MTSMWPMILVYAVSSMVDFMTWESIWIMDKKFRQSGGVNLEMNKIEIEECTISYAARRLLPITHATFYVKMHKFD